jgi:hypothetical protein
VDIPLEPRPQLKRSSGVALTLLDGRFLRPASSGAHDGPPWLGLVLGVGIPVFVLTILTVVFFLVRSAVNRQMAAGRARAAEEGVVLDAGSVWMTIRYRGFRSSNVMIGVGIRKTRVAVFLTRAGLRFLPGSRHYFDILNADMGSFTAGIGDGGALHLQSDSPPNASGSIDYMISVPEATTWVAALTAAGARGTG